MYIIKLYWLHIKYSIKSASQFKIDFVAALFANFLAYFTAYANILIITHQFKNINGWNYNDMIFLTALHLFSYSIACSTLYGFLNHMENFIINGDIDRILLRPINPIFSMIFMNFNCTGLSQIVLSGVFLGVSIASIRIPWTFYRILVLVLSIIGGIFIQCASHIFFGSLSFWTKKSTSIARVLYYSTKNFINYPLSIYGNIILGIMTFILPWAFINYYPALFLLGKNNTSILYMFTPAVGLMCMAFAVFMTQRGVLKYEGVGN